MEIVTLIKKVTHVQPTILDLQDLQEWKYSVDIYCNGLLQDINNIGYDENNNLVIIANLFSFLTPDNELIIKIHGQNLVYERKVAAKGIPISDIARQQMVLKDVFVIDRERNTDNVELGYL